MNHQSRPQPSAVHLDVDELSKKLLEMANPHVSFQGHRLMENRSNCFLLYNSYAGAGAALPTLDRKAPNFCEIWPRPDALRLESDEERKKKKKQPQRTKLMPPRGVVQLK